MIRGSEDNHPPSIMAHDAAPRGELDGACRGLPPRWFGGVDHERSLVARDGYDVRVQPAPEPRQSARERDRDAG